MISYKRGVVTPAMLLKHVGGVRCTSLGVFCLLLCVNILALDIILCMRHDFCHGNRWPLGEGLIEVSNHQTILEFPSKHLLVEIYNFDAHFVEERVILPQRSIGLLAEIEEACG